MKKLSCLFAAIAALMFVVYLPAIAVAQEAPAAQKCDGPSELCAQVLDLRAKLDAQKALAEKSQGEKSAAVKAVEEDQAAKTEKAIAAAAAIAVMLKLLISMLKSWKGYFASDKGKAWLKVITLGIGFAAFVATNRGLGLAWWQSLIVAGGGPGAILVHELQNLIPVLLGKKKYVSKSEPPPPNDEKKDEPEKTDPADPPKDPPA
jgi:hypothetical protein